MLTSLFRFISFSLFNILLLEIGFLGYTSELFSVSHNIITFMGYEGSQKTIPKQAFPHDRRKTAPEIRKYVPNISLNWLYLVLFLLGTPCVLFSIRNAQLNGVSTYYPLFDYNFYIYIFDFRYIIRWFSIKSEMAKM